MLVVITTTMSLTFTESYVNTTFFILKNMFCSFFNPFFMRHQFSSVQLLSRVRLFETPRTAAHLSITNYWSLLKLMSIESVMPSKHLILCIPFSSHLQSFRASGSFPTSQFFASGAQSTGVSTSASVFPMNIQD